MQCTRKLLIRIKFLLVLKVLLNLNFVLPRKELMELALPGRKTLPGIGQSGITKVQLGACTKATGDELFTCRQYFWSIPDRQREAGRSRRGPRRIPGKRAREGFSEQRGKRPKYLKCKLLSKVSLSSSPSV